MTKSTPAPAEKMSLAQEVKRAIETAPSCAAIVAAKAKLEDLRGKMSRENEEIARLNKEHAAGKHTTLERAKDLLDGKEFSGEALIASIRQAHRRVEVINEAIAMQARICSELVGKLSGEVNAALKSTRQPLVTRMAAALRELRTAAAEDALIVSELNRNRVFAGDNIAFIPVSQSQYDVQWFAGVKAQGYAV
jgi:hypothetical protein